MLYTQKLLAELERKREQLMGYQSRYGEQLAAFRAALAALGSRFASAAAITAAQRALEADSSAHAQSVGARATDEYDRWRRLSASGVPVLPFGQTFAHHQEARAWAECLRGTTTFAVDGSQLPPWRDASVPIALVQAGLFENPHQPPRPYVKDVTTVLLTPDELTATESDTVDMRTGETLGYSQLIVSLRRFELEVETLVARMEHHAALPDGAPVLALYDGSLIVSFALKMAPPYRDRYVAAARRLLEASEKYRTPLIGYIDTSYARDIVTMVTRLAREDELPPTRGVHDALLWWRSLAWGDRSPAFISARDDLARMGYGEQQGDVAFVYFQAARDRPPARVEFPRWMLASGQLDAVMDALRAETVAGNGYPYPIEAADAVAVISAADRAQFYATFQDFAERSGLAFGFSRKSLSKNRRRV
jgi:hypothetical protein